MTTYAQQPHHDNQTHGGTAESHTATHPDAMPVRVATYRSYYDAERAVDHLSDSGFPVEHVSIVGRGVSTVEHVTGRLTKARAALAGLTFGLWLGLFLGLLFALFVPATDWILTVLSATLAGGIWGAVIGFIAQWATHGRRDFSSVSALTADHYEVTVDSSMANEATDLLSTLNHSPATGPQGPRVRSSAASGAPHPHVKNRHEENIRRHCGAPDDARDQLQSPRRGPRADGRS
jgi:hypothetical protein